MINNFHHYWFEPSRLPIAMLALALTALGGLLTGPLAANANPLFWRLIEAVFGGVGRRLDRENRKPADLIVRGSVITGLALILAASIGLGLANLCARWPFYGASEILSLTLMLSSGAVWRALLRLHRALKNNTKPAAGAYLTIARTTNLDLSASDDFTITRTGMSLASRSFDKSIVAPLFWYLIAGLPGAAIYAGLASLTNLFSRDGCTKGFGILPLGLERIAGFLPNFLAGLLLSWGAVFTPTARLLRALRAIAGGKKGRAPYAEGGAPLTALAWALNVSLGGPVQDRDGRSLSRQWVGPANATARLEAGHLRRAIYISIMACLLLMVLLAGLMVIASQFTQS